MRRPQSVTLIAVFCFIFACFFAYCALQGIMQINSPSGGGIGPALAVFASLIFIAVFIVLGLGLLKMNKECWKVLTFLLVLSTSTSTLGVFIGLLLWALAASSGTSVTLFSDKAFFWQSFLLCFLAQIIVLYYLVSQQVRRLFE